MNTRLVSSASCVRPPSARACSHKNFSAVTSAALSVFTSTTMLNTKRPVQLVLSTSTIKMILPIVDGVVRLHVNVEMSLMNLMVVLVVAMSIVMDIVMMNLTVLHVGLVVMVTVAYLVAAVLMYVEDVVNLITISVDSKITLI
jgi:hypothetical protein